MIKKVQKRTLFVLGVIITSLLGGVGGYIRANYSKGSSLLSVNVAHADVANWPTDPLVVDTGGCGCGGCSGCGGASGDGGGGADGGGGGCGDGCGDGCF